ncbi:MAG: hypothetical protein JW757_11880 [Anaerolineales bacterium]|nr:hypothetical protein [Anaerolineales bacterium]
MTKKQTTNLFLTSVFAAVAMTAIIWLTAGSLANRFDVVNEKFFNFYYPWQTRQPATMAYITAWVGYAVHNLLVWVVIYLARRETPKYKENFRWFNWAMLAINGVFIILHWVQTQVWYDGLAIAVPEVTSQGSVILMLVLILILETPRRGLILGHKVKFHKQFLKIIREYHGYIISWGIIYTFWYHPMEDTLGHLAGFLYMFLLMAQSVLLFNRAHLNKYWKFTLEAFVLIHGTLVAIFQGNNLWPMFAYGFGAMTVLTQIYGIGLNKSARRVISGLFVAGVVLFYALNSNLAGLNEVIRIPVIEYGLVFVFYLVFLGIYSLSKLFKQDKPQPLLAE